MAEKEKSEIEKLLKSIRERKIIRSSPITIVGNRGSQTPLIEINTETNK